MANMNIRTPRFYVDTINFLMSRGISQDGNFDVLATDGSAGIIGTSSEAALFDMKPLNKCTFDTSSATTSHVMVNIDTQTNSKKSFVAILNHNMASANAKVLIKGSDTEGHIQAVDMGSATAMGNPAEVVNADAISSSIITPATDGSTIVRFDESNLRYWGIQFEGTTGGSNNEFGSTDLFVGCVLIGEYYEMPHAPDLSAKRSIIFDKVSMQESVGGQRYSNMTSFGRQSTSTTKSPFSTAVTGQSTMGGRIAYDLNFSYLNSSDIMPTEYDVHDVANDSVVQDIWNRTNGPHIPFIFSCDSSSEGEGDNAESEHIFARFGQSSLDMTQVAHDVFNVSMRIEEEF
tara:strand:+ start:1722 stop:2759 length:1038 start_codon:yes stop_codon:yes gene_type:complete